MLASFASNPLHTKGRLFKETDTPYRNEFQRDKDRIIHSNAFRRLEYKTQVFVNHEGDHYRNRLTHSIEVASLARSIASALDLSEDLAECIALAHDLGHTPFGHKGEEELDSLMKDHGGFSHNAHSIKLLTMLEERYAAYNGLNLTWEVLDGIAKHNGPITLDIPEAITEYNQINDLKLSEFSSAEAQVAAFSDDIAYNGHDLEDGIRSGLFSLEDMQEIEFLYEYIYRIKKQHPSISASRVIYETVRSLNHYLINDLLTMSRYNIRKYKIETVADIRLLNKPLIEFSDEALERITSIRKFLYNNVYNNHYVVVMTMKCKKVIKDLFHIYIDTPEFLPKDWQQKIHDGKQSKHRIISDYIAGMTDRFAIKESLSLQNSTFNNLEI